MGQEVQLVVDCIQVHGHRDIRNLLLLVFELDGEVRADPLLPWKSVNVPVETP